jgi:hypothetical protein
MNSFLCTYFVPCCTSSNLHAKEQFCHKLARMLINYAQNIHIQIPIGGALFTLLVFGRYYKESWASRCFFSSCRRPLESTVTLDITFMLCILLCSITNCTSSSRQHNNKIKMINNTNIC